MKKITELTPEQQQKMVAFREEWRAVGLATGPADMDEVRRVINKFYTRIGQPPPLCIRCPSPLTIQVLVNLLKRDNLSAALEHNLGETLRDTLRDTLRENLEHTLGDNLSDNLENTLGENLWENLLDTLQANLGDTLENTLRANIEHNLLANLRDNLSAALWDTLGANLSDNLENTLSAALRDKISVEYTCLWGSLDAYWIGYYLYPQLYLRPMYSDDQLDLLNDWAALARSSYWIYPYTGICFVSDRPTQLHQDGNYRLHNADGPAVAFSDGWQEYYIRGVHVPAWLIERPDELTAAKIDEESNAEVRRVMIDRYTPDRYLRDSGAALVSEDQFGRLWRKSVPEDEDILMVEVVNSTPEPDGTQKTYWLRVNPRVKTAHEAVASTWVDENDQPIFADYRDYQPIFES